MDEVKSLVGWCVLIFDFREPFRFGFWFAFSPPGQSLFGHVYFEPVQSNRVVPGTEETAFYFTRANCSK